MRRLRRIAQLVAQVVVVAWVDQLPHALGVLSLCLALAAVASAQPPTDAQPGRRPDGASPTPSGTGPTIQIQGTRISPVDPDGAKKPQDPIDRALTEARGLYRLGRTEEAIGKLRDLFKEHPEDPRVYRSFGSALEATQKTDEALAVYKEAADKSNDPGPALIEVERMYRDAQAWQPALETCLRYREVTGVEGAEWVADEIESLVRTDRVGELALQALEAAVHRNEKDTRLRELYISALLHQGKAEKALEEAANLDRAQNAKGTILLRYAKLADDKQRYAAALAGYDRVLEREPPEPLKGETLYRRAQVLRHLGRLDESLAALEKAASSGGSLAKRARQDQASLLANDLHRPEEALAVYEKVLADLEPSGATTEAGDAPARSERSSRTGRPPRRADVVVDGIDGQETGDASSVPGSADEIRLAMADCQLTLSRPADASRIYQELSEHASDPAIQARAQFQVGEMYFYQGKLKEADEAYYKLVDTYPGVSLVNDALARILLLGENSDDGGIPVTALAQSEYQRRMGQAQKGLGIVDDVLASHPKSRAADDLLEERSKLLLTLGKVADARATVDTLAARFPDSPLAPRAYLALADALCGDPASSGTSAGDTDAQAVYLEILLRFPDSLEAGDARAALQRLKEKGKDSSHLAPEEAKGPKQG